MLCSIESVMLDVNSESAIFTTIPTSSWNTLQVLHTVYLIIHPAPCKMLNYKVNWSKLDQYFIPTTQHCSWGRRRVRPKSYVVRLIGDVLSVPTNFARIADKIARRKVILS